MFNTTTLSRSNNLIDSWNRINFKRELFVAFSLALITQTQLRVTALSAGIGELLILALIAYDMLTKLYREFRKKSSSAQSEHSGYAALGFFGFLFFLIVLGPTVFHYYSYNNVIKSTAIHNLIAYLYSAFVFIYFCKFELNMELLAWLFGVSLLAIITFEFFILPESLLFFEGVRFTALSKNPNQLALAVFLLPFIFFRAILIKKTNTNRFFNVACLIYSLVCIHLIKCDSILVANLGLIVLGIFLTLRKKGQIVYFVIPILIAITSFNILSKISAIQNTVFKFNNSFATIDSETNLDDLTVLTNLNTTHNTHKVKKHSVARPKEKPSLFEAEAHIRTKLWRQAIVMSLQHPFFGLGAGGLVVLADGRLVMEAHNTFLDVLIQSGLTGLILYLAFLLLVFIHINKKNRLDLLLMFYSILVFSCFHFILRQPIVWFYFAYLLTANSNMAQKESLAI